MPRWLFISPRNGIDVVLVDRGELNREASGTNAGSFHLQLAIHQLSGAGTGADRDRLLADARLSLEAFDLWNALGRELDGDLGVHQTGGWMVAETPEEFAILAEKHELEQLAGIETEVVGRIALADRAPYLSDRLLGASFCPAEGHANPLAVAPLYALRAVQAGATIRTNAEVKRIEMRAGAAARRFTVHTSAGRIDAHRVVDCAGAWAGELAAMVGLRLPVRNEGLHVNVTEPRPRMFHPMIQHIGRRLTLKQTEAGTFIIGGGWPTATAARPHRYPTQWRSAAGNLAVAVDVVPALADVRVRTHLVGSDRLHRRLLADRRGVRAGAGLSRVRRVDRLHLQPAVRAAAGRADARTGRGARGRGVPEPLCRRPGHQRDQVVTAVSSILIDAEYARGDHR